MSGIDPKAHPALPLLDRFADGELVGEERAAVSTHVTRCPDCDRTVREYRALFAALERIPAPQVPAGFSVRILDAVLPKPSGERVLVRVAARLYAGVAVAFAAVAAVVLGMSGPGPVTWAVAQGFSRSVEEGLATVRSAAVGGLDLVLAILELAPLAGVARSLLRGFEVAALALLPQHLAVIGLTLSLATLVLIWALSPARERGVPHVSLTL